MPIRTRGDELNAVFFYNAPSPTMKLVVLMLDHYARKRGYCFPKIKTLAKMASLGERTVLKALNDLSELGHIVIKKRRWQTGKQRASVYRIEYTKLPQHPRNQQNKPGAADAPCPKSGAQILTKQSAADAPSEAHALLSVREIESERPLPKPEHPNPYPPAGRIGQVDDWRPVVKRIVDEFPASSAPPSPGPVNVVVQSLSLYNGLEYPTRTSAAEYVLERVRAWGKSLLCTTTPVPRRKCLAKWLAEEHYAVDDKHWAKRYQTVTEGKGASGVGPHPIPKLAEGCWSGPVKKQVGVPMPAALADKLARRKRPA